MSASVIQSQKFSRSKSNDASRYVGDVKSNLREGYGVYIYNNNFFRYEGEWKQGLKDGIGNLKMRDGSYYKGQFCNGEIDGKGSRYWAHNGNYYEGLFEKGEICGKGVMRYADGSIYEGSWLDNKRDGEGILTSGDGSVYTGSFYRHKRHGEGKQIYSDGGVYEGRFINDKKHGHGGMIYNDGSKYEGQWRADEMHGEGNLLHISQISYNGMWNNGRPLDEVVKMCAVTDQTITIDLHERSFSITVECQTDDNEGTSESGRQLQIVAGIRVQQERVHSSRSKHAASATSATSASSPSTTAEPVAGRRSTPFGFEIDPYPLCTRIAQIDLMDMLEINSTSGASTLLADSPITLAVESPLKDGTPPSGTPTTPIIMFRETVINVIGNDVSSSGYDMIPVVTQRTVNGKATFLNLMLPPVDAANSQISLISDTPENKNPPKKKKAAAEVVENAKVEPESNLTVKNVKKKGSKKQDEKSEDFVSEGVCKAGDYVVIVEDVTSSPFLDILLEPLYFLVQVPQPPKRSKSAYKNK